MPKGLALSVSANVDVSGASDTRGVASGTGSCVWNSCRGGTETGVRVGASAGRALGRVKAAGTGAADASLINVSTKTKMTGAMFA